MHKASNENKNLLLLFLSVDSIPFQKKGNDQWLIFQHNDASKQASKQARNTHTHREGTAKTGGREKKESRMWVS